ncbi:MAG TPA: hypothetical protein VN721_11915 [Flavipsychrobacter sp.]|nr:hypothetical protein [Flavipsychrobacter sp.]
MNVKFSKILRNLFNSLPQYRNAADLAVLASNRDGSMPRWRSLGELVLPYHYMRPVLVPVRCKA